MPFTIPDESEAGTSIQAGLFQTDIDALVAGIARTGVISGCDVTAQGTPNLTVAVAAGVVESLGVPRVVTADAALVIASADVTNPRFDLVVATSAGAPAVVTGTAAAAPLPPNPTAGSVLLATIYVPALDVTIGAAQITDKRVLLAARGGVAFFGDGSDGTVTITGSTTLTRDMFYDVLTVQSGGTLLPNGFRVWCKTRCQVDSGGTINVNGLAGAAGGTAGGVVSGGSIGGTAGAGGAGGTGAGSNGTNKTNTFSAAGGAGGLGSGGAGGAGGTASAPAAATGHLRGGPNVLAGLGWAGGTNPFGPGPAPGGGGGGGDGTAGGGGGGGGFVLFLAARQLILNGTIESKGGNGGSPAAGNRGGGGGGSGGLIVLVYNTKTGSGSTSVAGGTGGTKQGTGVNGSDGGAGLLIEVANV